MSDPEKDSGLYIQSDRRDDRDRRAVNNPPSNNLRQDGERRHQEDRRKHFVNLVAPDESFYSDIVNWLMLNGADEWSIGPNDNEPEGSPVTCRVAFESAEKLANFKAWLDEQAAAS